MATVVTSAHAPQYSRRVSFNNLLQESPIEKSPYPTTPIEREKPANIDPSTAFFGNYSMSAKPAPLHITHRKRLRLPDPPSRSILKNKLSATQLSYNIANANTTGVSYHGNINDLVVHGPDSVPRSELAKVYVTNSDGEPIEAIESLPNLDPKAGIAEKESVIDDEDDLVVPKEAPKFKRSSFSGMTDEELMALDPQFSTQKKSDLNDYKFNSTSSYYSAPRRNSTTAPISSLGKQVYPSSNENNYRSVSLTVKHENFDEITQPRTILTVLSGRRHTWNSLDWLLLIEKQTAGIPCFLQDGDYLVVSGLIPLKFLSQQQGKRHGSTSKVESKIQQKCESILNHIMSNLPDDKLRLKVTVELILDIEPTDPMATSQSKNKNSAKTGTKFMIDHLFRQYQPMMIVMGNKSTNLNFKYPKRIKKTSISMPSQATGQNTLSVTHRGSHSGPQRHSISGPSSGTTSSRPAESEVDEYLIKLTSFLVKYSTVPVVLVGNATKFHFDPKSERSQSVSSNEKSSVTFATQSLISMKEKASGTESSERKNSAISDISIESFNGNDERSLSSAKESSSESNPSLNEKVSDILASSGEDRFLIMMRAISDQSLSVSNNYLEKVKSDTLTRDLLDSKVHQVYSSMAQARQIGTTNSSTGSTSAYKVKSLISYDPEEEKRNEKLIHDKKLDKTISRGSTVSSKSDTKVVQKKKSFLQKLGIKKT